MTSSSSFSIVFSGAVKAMFTPRISLPPLCRGLGGLEGSSQRSLQRNGTIRKTFSGGMAAIRRHSQCIAVKLQAVSVPFHSLSPENVLKVSLNSVSLSPPGRTLWWTWFVEPGRCSCSVWAQSPTVETLTSQPSESSCTPHRSCRPCSSTAQVRSMLTLYLMISYTITYVFLQHTIMDRIPVGAQFNNLCFWINNLYFQCSITHRTYTRKTRLMANTVNY